VCPDLSHFSGIVPCGITEHGVTSLHAQRVFATLPDVRLALRNAWQPLFGPW
jgi:lipoyl(octanoyl) transferase